MAASVLPADPNAKASGYFYRHRWLKRNAIAYYTA
jgi:hypothetical protein